jgi:enamine deaminase RidA (YjgF/YER057c/UK114 family)
MGAAPRIRGGHLHDGGVDMPGDMPVDERVRQLGLNLPGPLRPPAGALYPFAWVRVHGDRAYLSGHLPLHPDGSLADPLGKVGTDVTLEQGVAAARLAALAAISSLRRELGDLDRVAAWLRVFAMVNTAPGFTQMATVVNGFSETILEVSGPEIGRHARSVVGVAELPYGASVEIEAEVLVHGTRAARQS